jgi:hypothetical protein
LTQHTFHRGLMGLLKIVILGSTYFKHRIAHHAA